MPQKLTTTIFFNHCFDKRRFQNLLYWFFKKSRHGQSRLLKFLEKLKFVGFHSATEAGISISIDDLKVPSSKSAILLTAENKIFDGDLPGNLTTIERYQRIIEIWNRTSEQLKSQVLQSFQISDLFNPVYLMAFSGARGNISQIRQLVGMRGLMADPQGQIIDFPIRSNFREGLTLTEYLISCSGARKGIVDTALRTAASGYLTRRLVDVAHQVIISQIDCQKDQREARKPRRPTQAPKAPKAPKVRLRLPLSAAADAPLSRRDGQAQAGAADKVTPAKLLRQVLQVHDLQVAEAEQAKPLQQGHRGIFLRDLYNQQKKVLTLQKRLVGRILAETIRSPKTSFIIGSKNQEISQTISQQICEERKKVLVRSPLTCQSSKFICQLCYGWNLAEGQLVSVGEAVGVLAAQSIGEPGTQLTMRTFHTGGVFTGTLIDQTYSPYSGNIHYNSSCSGFLIRTQLGQIAYLSKNHGKLNIICPLTEKVIIPSLTLTSGQKKIKIFPKKKINQFQNLSSFFKELISNNKRSRPGLAWHPKATTGGEAAAAPLSRRRPRAEAQAGGRRSRSSRFTTFRFTTCCRRRRRRTFGAFGAFGGRTFGAFGAWSPSWSQAPRPGHPSKSNIYKPSIQKTLLEKNKKPKTGLLLQMQFPSSTLLYVRQGEYVAKTQLIAEFPFENNENEKVVENEQEILSQVSGEIYFENFVFIEKTILDNSIQLTKNFVQGLGDFWILFGRPFKHIVQNSSISFFKSLDLINKSVPVSQISIKLSNFSKLFNNLNFLQFEQTFYSFIHRKNFNQIQSNTIRKKINDQPQTLLFPLLIQQHYYTIVIENDLFFKKIGYLQNNCFMHQKRLIQGSSVWRHRKPSIKIFKTWAIGLHFQSKYISNFIKIKAVHFKIKNFTINFKKLIVPQQKLTYLKIFFSDTSIFLQKTQKFFCEFKNFYQKTLNKNTLFFHENGCLIYINRQGFFRFFNQEIIQSNILPSSRINSKIVPSKARRITLKSKSIFFNKVIKLFYNFFTSFRCIQPNLYYRSIYAKKFDFVQKKIRYWYFPKKFYKLKTVLLVKFWSLKFSIFVKKPNIRFEKIQSVFYSFFLKKSKFFQNLPQNRARQKRNYKPRILHWYHLPNQKYLFLINFIKSLYLYKIIQKRNLNKIFNPPEKVGAQFNFPIKKYIPLKRKNIAFFNWKYKQRQNRLGSRQLKIGSHSFIRVFIYVEFEARRFNKKSTNPHLSFAEKTLKFSETLTKKYHFLQRKIQQIYSIKKGMTNRQPGHEGTAADAPSVDAPSVDAPSVPASALWSAAPLSRRAAKPLAERKIFSDFFIELNFCVDRLISLSNKRYMWNQKGSKPNEEKAMMLEKFRPQNSKGWKQFIDRSWLTSFTFNQFKKNLKNIHSTLKQNQKISSWYFFGDSTIILGKQKYLTYFKTFIQLTKNKKETKDTDADADAPSVPSVPSVDAPSVPSVPSVPAVPSVDADADADAPSVPSVPSVDAPSVPSVPSFNKGSKTKSNQVTLARSIYKIDPISKILPYLTSKTNLITNEYKTRIVTSKLRKHSLDFYFDSFVILLNNFNLVKNFEVRFRQLKPKKPIYNCYDLQAKTLILEKYLIPPWLQKKLSNLNFESQKLNIQNLFENPMYFSNFYIEYISKKSFNEINLKKKRDFQKYSIRYLHSQLISQKFRLFFSKRIDFLSRPYKKNTNRTFFLLQQVDRLKFCCFIFDKKNFYNFYSIKLTLNFKNKKKKAFFKSDKQETKIVNFKIFDKIKKIFLLYSSYPYQRNQNPSESEDRLNSENYFELNPGKLFFQNNLEFELNFIFNKTYQMFLISILPILKRKEKPDSQVLRRALARRGRGAASPPVVAFLSPNFSLLEDKKNYNFHFHSLAEKTDSLQIQITKAKQFEKMLKMTKKTPEFQQKNKNIVSFQIIKTNFFRSFETQFFIRFFSFYNFGEIVDRLSKNRKAESLTQKNLLITNHFDYFSCTKYLKNPFENNTKKSILDRFSSNFLKQKNLLKQIIQNKAKKIIQSKTIFCLTSFQIQKKRFCVTQNLFPFLTSNLREKPLLGSLMRGRANLLEEEFIGNQILFNTGQFVAKTQTKFLFRKATTFLLNEQSILHVQHGKVISKNQRLYSIFYNQSKTGDIVQGIPKIEEIFEARKQSRKKFPIFSSLFQTKDFIFFEEKIFKYLRNLQISVVNNIQRIYCGQGIHISDKHIEIIVRQMTSNVLIIDPGQTGLLCGEIVALQWVSRMNSILTSNKIIYEPVLIGMTKTCLDSPSGFLSAASFQETTRILSRAAIQNQTDFLRGLKQNVILGNLIPIGTGCF